MAMVNLKDLERKDGHGEFKRSGKKGWSW